MPYRVGARELFVSYYASAEISVHLDLGWPVPQHILDLCAEFRKITCGIPLQDRRLPTAMQWYGLQSLSAHEKDDMISLCRRGGPYSADEREALLNYCKSDVDALNELLPAMLEDIDLPRALIRGRYMAAVARMEREGTPIDGETLELIRGSWGEIKSRLIRQFDHSDIFEGTILRRSRLEVYLSRLKLLSMWPRHPSGALDTSRETFKEMAQLHPELQPLRELIETVRSLRIERLAVGEDGRNRTLLGTFGDITNHDGQGIVTTGRNAPRASEFVFGPACWLRGLIARQSPLSGFRTQSGPAHTQSKHVERGAQERAGRSVRRARDDTTRLDSHT